MSVSRFFLILVTIITGVCLFLFGVVSIGVQYLTNRWALFFETCAGVTRAMVGYFSYIDHIGMIIALLLVLSGVSYAVCIALVEFVQAACYKKQLQEKRVRIIDHGVSVTTDSDLYAVTIGLWRPDVFVSQGLVDLLPSKALAAVIAHEVHHREARHPLVIFLFCIFHALFFYIPGIRMMRSYVHVRQEVSADKAAIRHTSRISLAEAFLSLYGKPVRSALAAVSSFSSLPERVEYLVSKKEPALLSFFDKRMVLFGGTVFVLLFGFVLFVPRQSAVAFHQDDNNVVSQICEGALQSTIQTLLH